MRRRRHITALTSALVGGALTFSLVGPADAAAPATDGTSPSPSLASPSTMSGGDRDDTFPYSPRSTPPATPLPKADDLLRSASPDALSPDTLSAATSSTVHQLDVVVVNPTGKTSSAKSADVTKLVADVSSYWSGQSKGRASFVVKKFATITSSASCKTDTGVTSMWTAASKAVAGKDWWGGGSPNAGPAAREHLVVLYPFASGDHTGEATCNGMLGLGTTPSKASVSSNGLTFALFGSTDSTVDHTTGAEFYTSRQSLAHELGHNFGLQHASTWWCFSGHNDGAFTSSACGMFSYQDPFDLMGGDFGDQGVPALSGPQKLRLGLLAAAQHRTVTDSSTLSLQPVPQNETSAPAGLQAAQVKDPSTGETYTVEYRPNLPGVTFPAGSPFVTSSYSFGNYTIGNGVRVLRVAPADAYTDDGSLAWTKNEQSLVPYGPATARTSYLPAGKTFTTRSGKVSIRVAAQGTTASVSFVVHRKARISVARTATTQRYRQTAVRVTARTATTNGARPTGTVTFKDGSKTLKAVRTSSAGVAAYTLPKTLSVKTHSVTATFVPDAATKARSIEAVAVGTKVRVTKAASAASVRLAHTAIKKGAKPKVTVKIAVRGITKPTGTIKLYENGHKVKTVKLTSSKKGKITVTLPKTKKRGTVKIVAKYSGTSKISAKTTKTVKLKVR